MSKIEEFKKSKTALLEAQRWAERIGKEYYGGTRGRGALGRIVSGNVDLTVYFQHSDGTKNYHASPKALNEALIEVIKSNQTALIAAAISLLEDEKKDAALEAAQEHSALLAEAGIEEG